MSAEKKLSRIVTLDRDNCLRFAGADDLAPLAIERVIVERVCAACLTAPILYEMDISQTHGQPFLHVRHMRTSFAGGHLCAECAARIRWGKERS